MAEKLKLATRHLSQRHLTTLNIFLTLTRNQPVVWDHTEMLKAADAILIDIDVPEGQALLNSLLSEKHQLLIAHGEHPINLPSEVLFLPKPLRSGSLLPILEQASHSCLNISPQAGSIGAVATKDTGASASTVITEKPYHLLDILVKNPQKIFAVTENNQLNYSAVFDKERRCYYYLESMGDIQNLLIATPDQYDSLTEIAREKLDDISAKFSSAGLDVPLWKAALSSSQGRLYEGLSQAAFYKLRHWPDLKTLGFTIPHMKLATVLRRGGSIDMLAEMTKTPVADVIDFINTCYILDYLEPITNPAETAELSSALSLSERKPTVAQQKKQGLFSKIRSRLGI